VGGVRISLGIRADKEPIKVLYSPKLRLFPLPKSHHIRVHRRLPDNVRLQLAGKKYIISRITVTRDLLRLRGSKCLDPMCSQLKQDVY
jgi:hypothetical protein